MRIAISITLLTCLVATAAAEGPPKAKRTLEANLQRLRNGYFPVIMMRRGGQPGLLKKANVGGRICVSEPTDEGKAFYKSDGLPIYIYVFDGDNVLMLKDFWKGARQKFYDDRKVEHLKRDPSLFDPAVRAGLKKRLRTFARGYRDTDVLAISVGHESSMTSFSCPLDFDYSEPALKAFRAWLAKRYKSIDALNKTWRMAFKSFNVVIPPITDKIIDREYPKYPEMHLAPWFDFREFMDDSFVDLMHELAAVVRKEAPHMPTSVTVTAVPSAYGGWDYARLLQPGKIDALETYEFPGDKGLIRGLTGGATVNVCSLYTSRGAPMKLRAWRNFFNGERANFFAGRSSQIFPEKDSLGGYSAEYAPEFALMRTYAAQIAGATLDDGGVRMIYSQPSVRCYWFIDNKPDGKTYPNRGSKWEIAHNTTQHALGGWQDLLGELGVHPLFESYLDLRRGKFRHGHPKTILATQYCSASKAELKTLEAFVRSGGTLLIDESFAMFDDRGNIRPGGHIPLIEVPRNRLRATFGAVDVPNAAGTKPTVEELGKGRIVLLNATAVRYREGKPPDRLRLRTTVAGLIGRKPTSLPGGLAPMLDLDVYVYSADKARLVGLCSMKPKTALTVKLGGEDLNIPADSGRLIRLP